MRLPILYALTYPERIQSDLRFPVMALRQLDFSPPDMQKFKCLQLAYEAAEAGGSKPVALNAADEIAVAAFLEGQIGFDEIPRIIEDVLSATKAGKMESINQVLATDLEARRAAQERVQQLHRGSSPMPRAASVSCPGE
jgi:1-deoxy-D-xylulose-5-phosphate reductoisomerase